jgi:hypothetical protein
MISYFKIDKKGNLWYLWSGFVRFSRKMFNKKTSNASENIVTEPIDLDSHITIPENKFIAPVGNPSLEKPITCIHCENQFIKKDFVEIEYEKIIEEASKVTNLEERSFGLRSFHP